MPCCDKVSNVGGMCYAHYKRRSKGDFSDTPIDEFPPIPPGLLDAVTARLEAVRHGREAEWRASVHLQLLVDFLLDG